MTIFNSTSADFVLICIENGHSFKWNEDRVTVFLKWTDFSRRLLWNSSRRREIFSKKKSSHYLENMRWVNFFESPCWQVIAYCAPPPVLIIRSLWFSTCVIGKREIHLTWNFFFVRHTKSDMWNWKFQFHVVCEQPLMQNLRIYSIKVNSFTPP